MKLPIQVFGLAGLCLFVSGVAVQGADGAGGYFKFDAGLALQQDVRVKELDGMPVANIVPGATVSDVKLTFDPGFRFDLGGGYNFNDAVALGVETGMIYNSVDRIKFKFVNSSGPGSASIPFPTDVNFFQIPILATLVYTLPLRSQFRPFVGGGAGGVASIFQGPDINTESEFNFAYQGMAGFAFAINPKLDIGVTYKFLGSTDHKFDSIKTGETY